MKETANYQLNQWDPEDRILRESFNSDNRKIDSAIAEANPLQNLGLSELTEDSDRLTLDLSGVDWSQYWEVRAYFELTGTGNGSISVLIDNVHTGYFNGLGNSSQFLARFSLSTVRVQGCVHLYRNGAAVGAVVHAAANGSVITDAYYAGTEVQSLDFVFERALKAGSRAWLCGVKK